LNTPLPLPTDALNRLVHKLHYAAYSWGFEAGKVGQHVDTVIAGNKSEAALKEVLAGVAALAGREQVAESDKGHSTNALAEASTRGRDAAFKAWALAHNWPEGAFDQDVLIGALRGLQDLFTAGWDAASGASAGATKPNVPESESGVHQVSSAPPSQGAVQAPQGWQPLPENEDERAMFDSGTRMYGDVRLSIAHALRIWALAQPGGSYADQCRIMANEVVKLAAPSIPTDTEGGKA
jgi:hypothetical protein